MGEYQVRALLKQDTFGRVERIDVSWPASAEGWRPFAIRRVACGSALPFSRVIARTLAARERRALAGLDGLAGVPRVFDDAALAALPSLDGNVPRARDVLLRSWLDGEALHLAPRLPADFFDHLDALVLALHARGVCHNDLHKEQNVVVGETGHPELVDFQLASVHRTRGRVFASRARDDLRHVEKHRRRYTRWGRGPDGAHEPTRGAGRALGRSLVARVWRRTGKPLYNFVTRGIFRTRDGEARRPSSGPWPSWTEPVGPRPKTPASERRAHARAHADTRV